MRHVLNHASRDLADHRPARLLRARSAGAALGLVAIIAVGACGQKGGNDTVPQAETPSTSSGATSAPASTKETRRTASTAPASTGRRGSTTTSDDVDSTTSSTSAKSSTTQTVAPVKSDSPYPEFCQALAQTIADLSNVDSSTVLNDLPAYIALLKSKYQALTALVPPDIQADWKTINDQVQSMTDEAFLQPPDDPTVKAAEDNLSTWTKANCGFDPDAKK